MASFISQFDFADLDFDVALRLVLQYIHYSHHPIYFLRFMLNCFRLPGEAQKIDRILSRFANNYYLQNPTVDFANAGKGCSTLDINNFSKQMQLGPSLSPQLC
jgi:Sec7-like guanine-nucleotide exchange factor